MIYRKNKKEKGYALLFAIIITSIISVIVAGLSNLTYKQSILNSLVKDSQLAFYMADTAAECALYADFVKFEDGLPENTTWKCGVDKNNTPYELKIIPKNPVADGYDLNFLTSQNDSPDPCFEISVEKTFVSDVYNSTKIKSRGYNICNKSNTRTVQREIEINY